MRKRYTDEDIVYIEQQARRGVSCKEIGSSLDVSAASIQHVLSRRGIKFCRTPFIPIPGEVWRPCLNIPDIQVSNMGRFLRCSSNSIITGYQTTGGYITVDFSGNGTYSAHRLVALTFIPNPENKPEVNHLDGNKTNNSVANLEWATPAENIQHAFRTGLVSPSYGQSHHRTALNEQQIKTCSEMHQNGRTFAEIAGIFGVDRHTVSRHVNLYRRSTERSETIP